MKTPDLNDAARRGIRTPASVPAPLPRSPRPAEDPQPTPPPPVSEPPAPPSSEVSRREAPEAHEPDDAPPVLGGGGMVTPQDGEPSALDVEAPSMGTLYGLDHLRRSEDRELVELERLPGWPATSGEPFHCGHGIGPELAARLGYGVAPGELVAVGAAHAGAGKTAFVMQVADGLALRCLNRGAGPMTPVFVLSEMAAEALTYRTLARWTGHPAYLLRGGKTTLASKPRETRAARAAAAEALSVSSELQRSRHFMRRLDTTKALAAGATLVDVVARHVETWRDQLAKESSADVVPVVVVDPLQRWQSAGDEVASLNQLVTDLGNRTAAHGWITIITSDTNKASAKGDNANENAVAEGAGVFRGSYNLIHQADAVVYLRPAAGVTDEQHAVIEAVPVKARWGSVGGNPPAFLWKKENGRFYPMTEDEMEERRRRAAQEAASSGKPKSRRKTDTPPTDDSDDIFGGEGR